MAAEESKPLVVTHNSIGNCDLFFCRVIELVSSGVELFGFDRVAIRVNRFEIEQVLVVVKNEVETWAPSGNSDRFRLLGVGDDHPHKEAFRRQVWLNGVLKVGLCKCRA